MEQVDDFLTLYHQLRDLGSLRKSPSLPIIIIQTTLPEATPALNSCLFFVLILLAFWSLKLPPCALCPPPQEYQGVDEARDSGHVPGHPSHLQHRIAAGGPPQLSGLGRAHSRQEAWVGDEWIQTDPRRGFQGEFVGICMMRSDPPHSILQPHSCTVAIFSHQEYSHKGKCCTMAIHRWGSHAFGLFDTPQIWQRSDVQ